MGRRRPKIGLTAGIFGPAFGELRARSRPRRPSTVAGLGKGGVRAPRRWRHANAVFAIDYGRKVVSQRQRRLAHRSDSRARRTVSSSRFLPRSILG
jgi:hypothetical protein